MRWQLVLHKDHRGGRSWPPNQTSVKVLKNEFCLWKMEGVSHMGGFFFSEFTRANLPPQRLGPWVKTFCWATQVFSQKTPPTESQGIDKHRIFRSLRKEITSQSDVKRRNTFFGAWFQHAMSQPTKRNTLGQRGGGRLKRSWAAWNYPCSCPPAGPLKSYGLSSLVELCGSRGSRFGLAEYRIT